MSDRSAPVPTRIVAITIVAITMVMVVGCVGAPEITPATAVAPPALERDSGATAKNSEDIERRPDAGIARVTAEKHRADIILPSPVIELNELSEIGPVEAGFVVLIPGPTAHRVMPLAEPELPSAIEQIPTDDPVQSNDAGPPAELERAGDPEPSGVSELSGQSGLVVSPAPVMEVAPAADARPVDTPDPAAGPAVIARQERRTEPASSREELRSAIPDMTTVPAMPVVAPPVSTSEAVEQRSERIPSEVTIRENERSSSPPEPRATAPLFSEEPQTTRNTRTVPAESQIEVRLPGVSWLFLGSEPPVTFLGRETDPDADETLFRFRVPEAAHLRFEAQDLASGARTRHEETVQIASRDPAGETAGDSAARRDGNARSGQSAETPRRSNADGVEEMAQPSDGSSGSDGADEPTYSDYLDHPERPFDPDHHAAIIAAIANDDDALRDVSSAVLLSYADRVSDADNPVAARDLLQAMWGAQRTKSDEVLYRLARLAERDGPTRDLRRARELYSRLVGRYPFSVHYRDSEERIRYLNRHFFHIR